MLAGMFNKLILLNNLNRGLWEEEFEVLLVSLLFGLNATCFAPNRVIPPPSSQPQTRELISRVSLPSIDYCM